MQIDSLRYFTQVADLKSISKVANNSHISQPALSQQLTKLENELGENLFERSNRGVEITKRGEIVYKHAKKIIESYEYLLEELDQVNIDETRINITADGIVGSIIIAKASIEIIDIFSEYRTNINNYWDDDGRVALLQNKSDIVICSTKIDDADVVSKKIGLDKFILISKKEKELKKDPLIIFLDDGKKKIWFEHEDISFRTNSFSLMKKYLDKANTYAIVPYMSVKKEIENGTLVEVENCKKYNKKYNLYLSYKKNINCRLKKKISILSKNLENILNK